MRQQHILVLAMLFVLTLFAGSALADDHGKKTIFYNITSDDVWTAGMAAGQASKALESGYNVVVFLNVRGVYLASTDRQQDTFAGTGKSAQQMLQVIMKNGGRVIMCPMCMKQAGLTMDDVIEGVERGGPGVTFELMTADDTVVVSY